MIQSNLLPIAKQGFLKITIVGVALLFAYLVEYYLLLSLLTIILLALFWIYRNPERELPEFQSESVVSPVDGKIISIETLREDGYQYRVEIRTNNANVGVLRVPFDAKVKSVQVRRGAKLSRASKLYKKLNEQVSIVFANENKRIKIKHILNESLESAFLDVSEKTGVKQAVRYGMLDNFTSFIYLPDNFRLSVSVSQELRASRTLLGYFS